MNDLTQQLKVGDLLVIETGEYSDKNWHGPVRVLITFIKQEAVDCFRGQWKFNPERRWEKGPSPYDFLPWLVREGYVEDVQNVTSWHVGSYGEFEP